MKSPRSLEPQGTLFDPQINYNIPQNNGYWVALAPDGTRRIVGWALGQQDRNIPEFFPGHSEIYLLHGNGGILLAHLAFNALIDDSGMYVDYDWSLSNSEPVNPTPWLEGFRRIDGRPDHVGWMRTIASFAHEAVSWDDRQILRLQEASHAIHPDAAHSTASRQRARLALTYGRLLTGWMFRELRRWEGASSYGADDWSTGLWKLHLQKFTDDMAAICDEHCSTPHWMRELAMELAPDAWEDALAEQAQKGDLRAVTLPKIDRTATPWQPISTAGNAFHTHTTTGNPLREWETLIGECAKAVKRFDARYATRAHG